MTRPYEEFNDKSLIERMNIDQKRFNTYQEAGSDDPDEAWKSNAVRPIVRNKAISIAAHTTGALLFPQIYAQNKNDEEDKDAGIVMRDLMEWAAYEGNYEKTFLFGVISGIVNPAVVISTEYSEVWRTIKEINEQGGWKSKQVLDEVLSGFNDNVVPLDELYIADPYENDIQKQGYLIRRRTIEFSIAEKKYADRDNFRKYVRPGRQTIFDEASDTFYDEWDENLQDRLVEELIYSNRAGDLQIPVVNGIMLDDPDQPNPRDDKLYPYAKSGYELIDEGKFFYYKSMVFKTSPDAQIIDEAYRMIIDGAFYDRMPAMAIFGNEVINSAIVIPGGVTSFGEKSRAEKIDTGGQSAPLERTLDRMEGSVDESTASPRQAGQETKGDQTAQEVRRLEQNARTMLGLFGKMIGFLVRDWGVLKIGDIIQFMTVADVQNITTEAGVLKFRNFVLPNKMIDGKIKSKKIVFDMNLPDSVTEKEKKEMGFKLLEEEGGLDSKVRIAKVNPALFRQLKFLIKIIPELKTPESDTINKLLDLETYDRAMLNPFANQQTLYTDLLLKSNETTREDPDKYIRDAGSPTLPGLVGAGEVTKQMGREKMPLPAKTAL